jgi:hypothetical protein
MVKIDAILTVEISGVIEKCITTGINIDTIVIRGYVVIINCITKRIVKTDTNPIRKCNIVIENIVVRTVEIDSTCIVYICSIIEYHIAVGI